METGSPLTCLVTPTGYATRLFKEKIPSRTLPVNVSPSKATEPMGSNPGRDKKTATLFVLPFVLVTPTGFEPMIPP